MKYIQISRSDVDGYYIQPFSDINGAIEGEFDGIEHMKPGTSVTLTVVEMSEEEYSNLSEFTGW